MPFTNCAHPAELREAVNVRDGKYRCRQCGKVYVPRGARVYHGTYRGYSKHHRVRNYLWPWPIPEDCGCLQAAREFRRAVAERPQNKAAIAMRSAARKNALQRLGRCFPGIYAQFYTQEMARREPSGALLEHVPDWDDVIARLVKEALGKDEATVIERVRSRIATGQEREVMRQVTRLRVILGRRGEA